uniref:Uncharacterized protein n=1 Tax=Anguilla anguilla TaxID=7936 RepID=A0A0E9QG11_ANGAN
MCLHTFLRSVSAMQTCHCSIACGFKENAFYIRELPIIPSSVN